MKRKIILSSITTLALLLGGCTDEQKAAAQAAMSNGSNVAGTTEGNTPSSKTVSRNTNNADTPTDESSNVSSLAGTTEESTSSSKTGNGNTNNTGAHTGESPSTGNDEVATGGSDSENTDDDGNTAASFIPGPGNGADIPVQTNKTGGWYGRTAVSATATDGKVYSHSTAGVFGELVDSNEAKDQHDIPGYGSAILQVVFPQSDWADDNGDYFSNYQSFSENNSGKRSWTFQIKNQQTVDLKDAAVTIAVPEVKKVTYKKIDGKIIYDKKEIEDNTKQDELTLIDVDNATSYTVAQLATANLNMNGLHTRTFKWVLGTVEDDDYASDEAVDSSNVNIETDSNNVNITNDTNTITADGFDTASVKTAKAGGKFGLPPM